MKFLGLLLIILSTSLRAKDNLTLVRKLSAQEQHGNVIAVIETPSLQTIQSVLYNFQEIKLRPRDVVYFYIPDSLSKFPLSLVGLAHRQKGWAPMGLDHKPGLTSVMVYTLDMPGDELRYWAGQASGKLGAKYAAYRQSGEHDTLFEWPRQGHYGIKTQKSKDLIRPHAIRIQNTGYSPVYLSSLLVETIPRAPEQILEYAFTPKSTFGDLLTQKGRYYGGGQNQRGTFPKALRLADSGHRARPALPDFMKIKDRKLFIDLSPGTQVAFVDIMCGDSHPNRLRNKDGAWGTPGNASLSVYIENKLTGERRYLLEDKNVGPQGVMSAFEYSKKQHIKKDEHLVISNKANKSPAYIMALRLGLNYVK